MNKPSTTYPPIIEKEPTMSSQQTLVSWDETSTEELALLRRVESEVLTFHDQSQKPIPRQTTSMPFWRWPALASCAAFAIWMMWLGFSPTAEIPTLQAKGMLELKPIPGKPQIQTTLHNGAKLKDPQGWSLRSHAHTHMHITRRSPRESELTLKRGAVSVHVVPGSMKKFVIHCRKQLSVVVKGTKFLVWQNKRSVRVEVTRGHVLLKRGKQSLLHLYKGQGVHIQNDQNDLLQTYRVPEKMNWLDKIESLAKHQPTQLYAYALALNQDQLLPKSTRLQVLETAAHALQGHRYWRQASRVWRQVYKLHQTGFGAQTALYQAAQNCRRSKKQVATCVRLFRSFLRRFPAGMPSLREKSLYWSGALALKAHSQSDKSAKITLMRYLKTYPNGTYTKRVKRLLSTNVNP